MRTRDLLPLAAIVLSVLAIALEAYNQHRQADFAQLCNEAIERGVRPTVGCIVAMERAK